MNFFKISQNFDFLGINSERYQWRGRAHLAGFLELKSWYGINRNMSRNVAYNPTGPLNGPLNGP